MKGVRPGGLGTGTLRLLLVGLVLGTLLGVSATAAESPPEGSAPPGETADRGGAIDAAADQVIPEDDPALAAGDAALFRGDHERAAAIYEDRLAEEPRNAALRLNLGLAYAHIDRLGPAAYHLMQAHFLAPGDDDISKSLALVEAEVRRRRAEEEPGARMTTGKPAALFWLDFFHRLKRGETELFLIGVCWLAFGLLFARRRMQPSGRRDGLTVLAILCFILLAGTVAYRAGAAITRPRIVPAVVIAEAPMLREGPDRQAARRTERDLFSGAIVLIEEERGRWVAVELANGRPGWLASDDLRRIEVPE